MLWRQFYRLPQTSTILANNLVRQTWKVRSLGGNCCNILFFAANLHIYLGTLCVDLTLRQIHHLLLWNHSSPVQQGSLSAMTESLAAEQFQKSVYVSLQQQTHKQACGPLESHDLRKFLWASPLTWVKYYASQTRMGIRITQKQT